ncbi:16879_t:CDS:2 [Dentiscutata erythropus]|uniref:16879_t:CDS:1 n=1 Tax=Dentiscutata erythropus TaxID=1348616 RepID=A0A9N9J8C7_9GLOM|nr:16879_t:CDS:2 [Dentiscutata erythropus]
MQIAGIDNEDKVLEELAEYIRKSEDFAKKHVLSQVACKVLSISATSVARRPILVKNLQETCNISLNNQEEESQSIVDNEEKSQNIVDNEEESQSIVDNKEESSLLNFPMITI